MGRVGPFLIYGYTVALAGSIALGLALTQALTRRVPAFARLRGWVDGALAALVGGLLGGRSGFVAGEWAYFAERPSLIWQVGQGGLSYHGALLGSLIVLWLWTLASKQRLMTFLNLLAPAFALTNVGGWVACWLEGCAYGRQTRYTGQWWHDWLAADLPDTFGLFALRYQTQLLGAILGLLALLLTLYTLQRRQSKTLFWLTLGSISITHLLISLLRGDPAPQLTNLRIDAWLNALLATLSVIQYRRHYQPTNQLTN